MNSPKLWTFFISLLRITTINECHISAANGDLFTLWANKIGNKLWELGSNLTRQAELKSVYSSRANITELEPHFIIHKMAEQMHNILARKKNTLYQIVREMEQHSVDLPDYPDQKRRLSYMFRDVKNLTQIDKDQLWRDINFFNENVSIHFSTVHVPTDVFNRSNETTLGIQGSEGLDAVFRHNYAIDPTLSWQYFAGASGYMRIFPGVAWSANGEGQENIFDARNRPWYIEAATDPKDIVILVDNSGSMMGQKKKIARHTVNTILETLGPNDFVNIFQFEEETLPVVECFKSSLVQANLVTIRELKFGVENMSKANNLANFPDALTKAFEVLYHHRREHLASMCNQAIMLITDGVPDSYTDIFQKYNWKNTTEPPFPVRVFTYLIGRDGADHRETKWMACANQGYYVQLNTIPEVKEQVFNYINVLARPLVLKKSKKIAWTSLYAHKIDPKITDYRWEKQQNEQQKLYTNSFRGNWKAFLNVTAQKTRAENWKKIMLDQNKYANEEKEFHFMISLSHPAYDQRPKRAEVAALLGVAGTDIPITEFRKLMKPYYLGVNNYGFIVNNNGYIIVHPDHRPFFRGTLKPGYNSVDLLEVELLDTNDVNKEPRDFDIQVHLNKNGEPTYILSNLSLLRDLIINQTDNGFASFQVKYHYDNMKRVSTGRRNYHIKKIQDSPLTLVLAIMRPPCNSNQCQAARLIAPNPERKITVEKDKVDEIFSGNWNIHPEWFYCKMNYNNELYRNYSSENLTKKTTELVYFLKKMADKMFWDKSRDPYEEPPEIMSVKDKDDWKINNYDKKYNHTKYKRSRKEINILTYYCDPELIRNVLFDANVTRHIFRYLESGYKPSAELYFSEGSIKNVFVATHSGLTRWKDLTAEETSFGHVHGKSIDELWYKRAVEHYYTNKESFTFSIPIDEGYTEDLLVTASHAIFVKGKNKGGDDAVQAAAAVVGYQFLHSDLDQFIRSVIQNDGSSFYVLDNNGYIVTSTRNEDAGKFFGILHPDLMHSFEECRIFRRITIYDYQGVCFYEQIATNAAYATLTKPLQQVNQLISWTTGTFITGMIRINIELFATGLIHPFTTADYSIVSDEEIDGEQFETFEEELEKEPSTKPKYSRVKHVVVLNRTRPQTCDRKVELYQLQLEKIWERRQNCSNVTSLVRLIPHTNLLLVVLFNISENTGQEETKKKKNVLSTEPVKVKTNNEFSSPVCYKVNAVLSRRRPSSCCKDDKDEKKIVLCGRAASTNVSVFTLAAYLLTCYHYVLKGFF